MPQDAAISLWERVRLTALLGLGAASSYLYLNQHPPSPPQELLLTPLDQATPFVLWTVWPYFFLTASNALLSFLVRDRATFRTMAFTLALAMALHAVIWAIWPTSYPRPPQPVGESPSHWLYAYLTSVDSPANCFPSAHISGPSVQLYFLSKERPQLAVWLWGAFLILAPSVLTTKQHYVWDVLGAALCVWASVVIGQRWWGQAQKSSLG